MNYIPKLTPDLKTGLATPGLTRTDFGWAGPVLDAKNGPARPVLTKTGLAGPIFVLNQVWCYVPFRCQLLLLFVC